MKSTNIKQLRNIAILAIFFTAALFLISGCDDSGGITVPSGVTNMSVSAKNSNTINPGGLVITEAKAFVSNVIFETQGTGQNEEIPVSPFVVVFSLDGSLANMTSGYLIRDNYINIKFQLHKPDTTETPADPEFKTGNLDNQRFSFIIKGTYNGNSFVYKSKQSLNVVINFSTTQNINLANMNFTVLFDMSGWFKNGASVLNPNDANNSGLIDANILNSFKQAFMDNNKDGNPD